MDNKTFQVPNIGCDGCVRTIKTELSEIPGVKVVQAEVASKLVTVQWDNPATWEQITSKLTEIDYAPATA